MKKVTAALAVLLALTLTGCASGQDDAPSQPEQGSETVAPLAVEPTDEPVVDGSPEAQFVERVKVGLVDTPLESATDEQLLAAGQDACQQLADGVPYKDVLVVEGDTKGEDNWYRYSSAFSVVGGSILCPDVYPKDAPRI